MKGDHFLRKVPTLAVLVRGADFFAAAAADVRRAGSVGPSQPQTVLGTVLLLLLMFALDMAIGFTFESVSRRISAFALA